MNKILKKQHKRKYKQYDEEDKNGEIGTCTRKAWEKVGMNKNLGI